ncbi:MAG: hypothetical protein ACKVOE_11055 [Rickettsiales bacterium]
MQPISLRDLTQAAQQLSELLMLEGEHLRAMRVGELAALQEEKLRLTRLLETAQAHIAADKNFLGNARANEREELLLLADDLAYAVEENFRHASVARAVNRRVMQAITDVMSDQQRPATYDRMGLANSKSNLTLSLNLNERA